MDFSLPVLVLNGYHNFIAIQFLQFHSVLVVFLIDTNKDLQGNIVSFSLNVKLQKWMSYLHWSFIEKTSVKQSMKCKVCSNFQMYPQYRHLVAKNGTKLGPVELSSDVPLAEPSSGQEWY